MNAVGGCIVNHMAMGSKAGVVATRAARWRWRRTCRCWILQNPCWNSFSTSWKTTTRTWLEACIDQQSKHRPLLEGKLKKYFKLGKIGKKMKNLVFLIYVLQSIFSEILCLDSHDLCEKLQRNTPGWVGVFWTRNELSSPKSCNQISCLATELRAEVVKKEIYIFGSL